MRANIFHSNLINGINLSYTRPKIIKTIMIDKQRKYFSYK